MRERGVDRGSGGDRERKLESIREYAQHSTTRHDTIRYDINHLTLPYDYLTYSLRLLGYLLTQYLTPNIPLAPSSHLGTDTYLLWIRSVRLETQACPFQAEEQKSTIGSSAKLIARFILPFQVFLTSFLVESLPPLGLTYCYRRRHSARGESVETTRIKYRTCEVPKYPK